jgi:hypothetical protein
MKRSALIAFITFDVIVVALAAWFFYQQATKPPTTSINSYADCVAAGYPIQESYPEQCRTPDGKSFTNPDAHLALPEGEFTSTEGTIITLEDIEAQSKVQSPLAVTGKVPGNWSFEGSFPVQVTNEGGVVLVQTAAQLEGDWMTEELVPFSVTLTFERPGGNNPQGYLVLKKDNPSGLSENDDSVTIPIVFK